MSEVSMSDLMFPAEPRQRDIARELYGLVRELPLISPHGHVDPGLLAGDEPFPDPARLLIVPDHYITRMLLSQGIPLARLGVPSRTGVPVETDPRAIWPHRTEVPQPIGPPIEQLAADLRRLLRLHEELTSSAHIAMLAHRLWAVEAAIGDRAVEAARALDVPHREPKQLEVLTLAELTELLHGLARAGLMLPAPVAPFTKDGRL